MPARRDIESVLIIGSGPIVIGQACEFDYSGNQAVRALREEGYRVILVNPNPATVMTTPGLADRIYMDPLSVPYLDRILENEKPDALLPTMGGQTALNLTIDLAEAGVLEKHGVEILGAPINSIQVAEDRGKFKDVIAGIGLESPHSAFIHRISEGHAFVSEVGLPVIIRPSYTLGGKGGSIAETQDEFEDLLKWALAESPVHTALVEESLLGWKEFELEVMRDHADNAVIVCSIENIDGMGIHTGDSVTVAPIQTLSDREYQRMRSAAIEILRAVGVDCGGSNVQFAVNPADGRMVVIEMNPRVSRSSALASKATGFPIARCAARLAVGFTLDEVINDITGQTVSCFEPSLDYTAVKIPRFELEKFPQGYATLGTAMKSVGESLAIGRTYTSALNKALRAAEIGFEGIEDLDLDTEELWSMAAKLHPRRIFAAYTLLTRLGREEIERISRVTGYDRWGLYELAKLAELEGELRAAASSALTTPGSTTAGTPAGTTGGTPAPLSVSGELLFRAKREGISDRRIARLLGVSPGAVEQERARLGLHACYHFVDTCSGEFAARTPYFYSAYGEIDEGEPLGERGVVILGSGPNRIGQGLEFDTCCTLSSMAYRELDRATIMINSNPETVSTDFNVSDRLYLEPLSAEDVKEIMRKEGARDVVVQLGGQTALNMAEELEAAGARVVGTPVKRIHDAEDRGLFYDVMRRIGLDQPRSSMAPTRAEVERLAGEIGYPVLLRPSYVLGGRSMGIAYTPEELREFLDRSIVVSEERPVLVDQFLEDAFEYDLDALCDGERVYIGGIMQHIEAAGIHSGDSACVFPAYKIDRTALHKMKEAAAAIARELGVVGFLNIQFAVQDGTVYVLEVNPRASRTVPYLSKSSGINLVEAAVRIWQGQDLRAQGLVTPGTEVLPGVAEGHCAVGWAVKEAVFSFDRFPNVDPLLGPEMRSTGEAIGIGTSFGEAFAKATGSAGSDLPTEGRVFVSIHDSDKETLLPVVRDLENMGFRIAATRGTADFLFRHGIFTEVILKVHEGHPNVVDHLDAGRIDLVVNTPLGRFTQRDDDYIRIQALRHRVPYTTTTSAAEAAVEGIRYLREGIVTVEPLPEPHSG
ncbi:MAG: carbamoyl-phosphate synthase large subunit [Spirochaetaceae bacterium]